MADPDATPTAPLVLGDGIVARSRPRLGTSHRRHRPGAIGIVGRSSVGFGRIIAAAGSSRPRVTTDALTTWSLRPPFPTPFASWMSGPATAADEPVAPTSWTTRAVPTVSRRAAPPTPAVARTPARTTTSPRPAPPTKVDALRRLLESRGMIEPSETNEDVDAPAQPAVRTADDVAGEPTGPPGDRAATSAGPTTAPGQLGRRARPESVPGEDRLAEIFADRPTGRASDAARSSPRSATPRSTASRSSASRSSASRSSASRSSASRSGSIDRFRAALESRGMIASERSEGRSDQDGVARRDGRSSSDRHRAEPTVRRRADQDDDADRPPAGRPNQLPLSLLPEHARTRRGTTGRPSATRDEPERSRATGGPTAWRSSATVVPVSVRPDGAAPISITWRPDDAPTDPSGPDHPGQSRPAARSTDVTAPDVQRRAGPATTTPDRTPPPPSAPPSAPPTAAPAAPATTATPTATPATTPATAPPNPLAARSTTPTLSTPGRSVDAISRAPRPSGVDDVGLALREAGRRAGLPHSWSDRRRPRTELSDAIRRSPVAGLDVDRGVDVVPTVARSDRDVRPAAIPIDPGRGPTTPAPLPESGRTLPSTPAASAIPSRTSGDDAGEPPRPVRRRPGALAARIARRMAAPRPDGAPMPATTLQRALASTVPTGTGAQGASPPDVAAATTGATSADARAERARTAAPPHTIESRPADTLRAATLEVPVPTMGALAERFLQELGREAPGPARELPEPYRPLASAIAGSASRVRISHDAASARALRSVGKRAATVGDVIHLQRAPDHDARATEVLAHELTHVAHPSPVPRFFDDDDRGPEERMAERVASVIARSPVMPSAPAPSRRADSGTIRRSPTPDARPSAPGTISAESLAASIQGRAPVVQRRTSPPTTRPTTGTTTSDGSTADAVRRKIDQQVTEEGSSAGGSPFGTPQDELEWFERMVTRSTDYILRRIEERVMIDFERRGGRFWRNL